MRIGLRVKYPLFVSDSNKTLIFSTYFLKVLKYKISLKSVQLGLKFTMQTDRRTGGQKNVKNLVVAFRNLANSLKSIAT